MTKPVDDNRQRVAYLPQLDGLRGAAIVAVMLFHADVPFFPGGFIGVDVFFVLSGFLITTLLIFEFNHAADINLRRFYFRRLLRLGPALVAMLVIYSLTSLAVLGWPNARDHCIDALIAFFYVTNWARAFDLHPPDLLGHTWSLGIEEQFYIVWPLLLFLVLKKCRDRRAVVFVAIGLALLCWATRAYLAHAMAPLARLYNGLDTRADALMVGCALASLMALGTARPSSEGQWKMLTARLAPLAALALLVFCLFGTWLDPWFYYWGLSAVAILCAILIHGVLARPDSYLGSVLATRALTWTGSISYGLYLWHYPVFRLLMKADFNAMTVLAIGAPVTFAIAACSYYWLERPVLAIAPMSAWRRARPTKPIGDE